MNLDPANFCSTNGDIYEWRQYLKKKLLIQRHWRSDLSGELLHDGCHMHEGIVTRACVPKSISWQYLIFHPYNCFLLAPDEHIPQPPSREWCVQKAFDRYGINEVQTWFYTLPWKSIPFRI